MKYSPALSSLFLHGQRLTMPKPKGSNQTENNSTGGSDSGSEDAGSGLKDGTNEFSGRKHPTYFRFEKKPNSDTYRRNCELGRLVRIAFETDVENGYFTRNDNPGNYELDIIAGKLNREKISHSLDLHDGKAQWIVTLPDDLNVGDEITICCVVNDDVIIEKFINKVILKVEPKSVDSKSHGKRSKRTGGGSGNLKSNVSSGLTLPNIIEVRDGDKNWIEHEFDHKSGCSVMEDEVEGETQFTFYVNYDNINLQNELKNSKSPKLEETKYVDALVCFALSVVHDWNHRQSIKQSEESENGSITMQDMIQVTSRAYSPFILPVVNYLGSLKDDDLADLSSTGDEE